MKAELAARLAASATSLDNDPVIDDLFMSVVDVLTERGVDNRAALRTAEHAISFLVKHVVNTKEQPCPVPTPATSA